MIFQGVVTSDENAAVPIVDRVLFPALLRFGLTQIRQAVERALQLASHCPSFHSRATIS